MAKIKSNICFKIWQLYFEGFKNMQSWGRQVWIIILVKLFIMFVILKIFFFPNFLKSNFDNDQERSQYVLEVLTETNN